MLFSRVLRAALCCRKVIMFALVVMSGGAQAVLVQCSVGPCVQPIVVLSFEPGFQAVKPTEDFHVKVYVNNVDLLPSYAKLNYYDVGVNWDRNVAWLQTVTFGDFGGVGSTRGSVTPCANCFSGFAHFTQGTQGDTTQEPGTFLLFDMLFSALGKSGETQFKFGEVLLGDDTGTSGPIVGSFDANNVVAVDVVPEPSTLALVGLACVGVVFSTRRHGGNARVEDL